MDCRRPRLTCLAKASDSGTIRISKDLHVKPRSCGSKIPLTWWTKSTHGTRSWCGYYAVSQSCDISEAENLALLKADFIRASSENEKNTQEMEQNLVRKKIQPILFLWQDKCGEPAIMLDYPPSTKVMVPGTTTETRRNVTRTLRPCKSTFPLINIPSKKLMTWIHTPYCLQFFLLCNQSKHRLP